MKLSTVLIASFLVVLPLHANAENERPRGIYVPYEPPPGMELPGTELPEERPEDQHLSTIIYLNPCWGDCQLTGGWPDDSRINKSSIVRSGSATLSEFRFGQATWDAVVSCVREMYEPFGIDIVDEDPGNVEHFEAMVAGSPGEVGMQNGVGGVSPFSCGVIDNAITFSFANIYGGSVQAICEVVAQETAHAFGLDHEYLCEDPMTYLNGCGPKKFRDIDAPCGEFSERECQCGGSTQNSVQSILAIFGPSTPTPPTVEITEPADGSQVEPGFVVRINATDNASVERTELWINGAKVTELSIEPFVFNAPDTLGQGNVMVEVRAFDNRGDMGSDSINVVLGEPCKKNSDCEEGEVCIEGRCAQGPSVDGGLGQSCETGEDCLSGLCGSDGTDKFCVESCQMSCPGGFDCLDTGNGGVCWPGADDGAGGCGCQGSSGGAPYGGFLLALVIGAFVFRRRDVA